MNNFNLINLVSLCTALIATIVGPYVSVKTARSQINANVISANRVKRIETVRELVAGLIGQMITFLVLREEVEQKLLGDVSPSSEMINRFEKAARSVTVLRLLLNPNLPDNKSIVESLEWCIRRMMSKDEPALIRSEVEPRMSEIISLCQKILKHEWNRVKRGE